jgi:hypothetical protein
MKNAYEKNTVKYESYKLAFDMIAEAKERQCPLQAIAIEESILTDRLSSTLNVGKEGADPFDTLGQVLRAWHPNDSKKAPNPNSALFDDEMEKLYPRLKAWWNERNALLHGVAKSANGQGPETKAEDVACRAMAALEEGERLVREVDNWLKKQLNKISQLK